MPKAKRIHSPDNDQFRRLKSLLNSKGIWAEQQAILAGRKFIKDVFKKYPASAQMLLYYSDCLVDFDDDITSLPHLELSKELFAELDQSGTRFPLLTVKVPNIPHYDPSDPGWSTGRSLFLPLQSPDNTGAVLRSALAFGVKRIVLLKECAHPFLPRALRAAGPSVFGLEFFRGPSIHDLELPKIPCYALDLKGKNLSSVKFPENFALVVGEEGKGISESIRNQCNLIHIPIDPQVESLNAAMATSIALYSANLKT